MVGMGDDMSGQVVALKTGGMIAGIVPGSVEEVFRLATAVAKSGLAPRGMETAEKLTVAIMTGLEIGLPPMFAINKIAVVNGRPTIWGDAVPALLWGAGFKLREWSEDGTAHCEVARPDGTKIERTFSDADAKKAGLLGKQGPWQQFPDRMKQMRARGFAARDGAADVLGGLYVAEEVIDGGVLKEAAPLRRSAHAVRKSGDYERFAADVRKCETVEAIDEAVERWRSVIVTMPEGHEANALAFAEAIKMQITAPQDAPLSDVDGYLAKLRADRGYCDSDEDLAALREAHADLIDRLSDEGRAKAHAIIDGDGA